MKFSVWGAPWLGLLVIVFCIRGPVAGSDLGNLSDLSWIEDQLVHYAWNSEREAATRHEIKLIQETLEDTPPADRAQVLKRLAEDTKWGTLERATAYYACAWYGVNYERCRDYLLNIAFWYSRPYSRTSTATPVSWEEESFGLLYSLYEENYDLRLLHDLMTGTIHDGAGPAALASVKNRAILEHPHAILHVVRMSAEGRSFVVRVLTGPLPPEPYDYERTRLQQVRKDFIEYASKVAKDNSDPLQRTAQELVGVYDGKD